MSSASSADAGSSEYRGLINSVDGQVVEAMEGMLLANPHLNKLDGGRDIKVVVRADWNAATTQHVALLSGGGDGHAPAHAGFVGANMLTAAVSGEVFASPSVKAVLAGIRAVARSDAPQEGAAAADAPVPQPSPGVLLLVKNYTGDRLNFGIAMTQAMLAGIPTAMVIVGDDVTLPRSKGVTGRRGIAGTVLVHKIAGYAAAQGMSLQQVTQAAQHAADSLVSIGVATSSCNVPGSASSSAASRIPPGHMEVGIGIHGEAGLEQRPLEAAKQVVRRLVEQLLSIDPQRDYFHRMGSDSAARPLSPGTEVVLLVNNLGGATATEVHIMLSEALQLLRAQYAIVVRRVLCGSLMTALDMRGVSLTLLRLGLHGADPAWQLQALDSDVGATGWPRGGMAREPHPRISLPVPAAPTTRSPAEAEEEQRKDTQRGEAAPASIVSESLLSTLADTILANAALLNRLDARAGDGDCGSTLSLGAQALQAELSSGSLRRAAASLADVLQTLAAALGESMGGSSGGIVQILLTAAAAAAKQQESSSASRSSGRSSDISLRLATSLEAGVSSVSAFGGAVVGDRTMLDALVPALRAWREALAPPISPESVTPSRAVSAAQALERAAQAAREGAASTQGMVARAGRANYVQGDALTEQDPGAEAVALLFEAAAKHAAAGTSA